MEMRRRCNALFSKPPSTTGQPAEFKKLQSRSPPAFFFNRPPEAATVTPLTLLHPVFGEFVHDCDTVRPTREDNEFVLTVWREMSGFFKEEKDRANAFRRRLAGYGIDMAASGIGSYQTDGDLRKKGLCFAILEVKTELASGQADPLFQAASYYVASMRETSEEYPNARLPSILIYLFGQLQSIYLRTCVVRSLTYMCRGSYWVRGRDLRRWSRSAGSLSCSAFILACDRRRDAPKGCPVFSCSPEPNSSSAAILRRGTPNDSNAESPA